MTKLYYHINGSGTPFFFEKKILDNGIIIYDKPYWPKVSTDEFRNKWEEISILYHNHSNPIDIRFPSFWDTTICDLFNSKVRAFFNLSVLYLKEFELIDSSINLKRDKRLFDYRMDPIKYHLGLNKTFDKREDFMNYLDENKEEESVLVSQIKYYKKFEISRKAYECFIRVFLSFDSYTNFSIEFCPFSNRTFIAIMNISYHYPIYEAIRITREDLLNNSEKILKYHNNYLNE